MKTPHTESAQSGASTSATRITSHSRFKGALWGSFIGDALAVPAHGYTTRSRIYSDYGWIVDYTDPKWPHPDSNMIRIERTLPGKPFDILGKRREDWKKPGQHFHQSLYRGDNSLNLQINLNLMTRLAAGEQFDLESECDRYQAFMLEGKGHTDTYIPEAHRRYFINRANGAAPLDASENSLHLGGVVLGLPLLFRHMLHPLLAEREGREYISISHRGESIGGAFDLTVEIFSGLMQGWSLEEILFVKLARSRHPALTFPVRRWIRDSDDEQVAFYNLSTRALVSDSIPLVLYLTLKYADKPEDALLVNSNLGGDSCHRGSLIGLFLGAMHGYDMLPQRWIQGLEAYDKVQQIEPDLWKIADSV